MQELNVLLIIEIIIFLLGIVSFLLVLKHNIFGFLFAINQSLLSIYILYEKGLFLSILLHIICINAHMYGVYTWSISSNNHITVLPIHQLTKRQVILGTSLLFILGSFMGLLNRQILGGAEPLLDAYVFIFSAYSIFLTVKRYINSWIYWIFTDILSIILFFRMEYYFLLSLILFYMMMSIYGYFLWKRDKANAE